MITTERERLNTLLDLIERADDRGKVETLLRVGHATNSIMEFLPDIDLPFLEFKAALRPDQAEKVAKKTMQVGQSMTDLDNMAFYLVAASLYARAGADWIDPDQEQLIDELINIAVDLVNRANQQT